MKATLNGIQIFKAELRALLAFAESDKAGSLAVVHLQIEGDRVYAYATDSRRAVRAEGDVEDPAIPDGHWTIYRDFLDKTHKVLGANEYALLEMAGASLRRVAIVDEETLMETSSFECATDAADLQASFPINVLETRIKLPTTLRPVGCVTVPASQLSALSYLSKAASDTLDFYSGASRQDGVTFQCEGPDTVWTGIIMPMRDPATSETDDIDPDPHADQLFPYDGPEKRRRKGDQDEAPSAADRTEDLFGDSKMTVQAFGVGGEPLGPPVETSVATLRAAVHHLRKKSRKKTMEPDFVPPTEA